MKKYLYIIIAAATLTAVSCEKNLEMAPEDSTGQECSLTISLPTDTKITFDGADGYKSSWVVGDKIKVQTTNNNYTYTCTSISSSGKQATFTGYGTPVNGGQVLYPDDGHWSYSYSNRRWRYTFDDEYVWDGVTNQINSVVPMVGTIEKQGNTYKANLDYASGAIVVEYSKLTLSTAKLVVSFGNNKVTGSAPLSGGELSSPNYGTGSNVTIWMNSQHKMIGGTPENAKFLIPVPAGTYSYLNMKLYKEKSGSVEPIVGGSDFSMASGKSLTIKNKDLMVLPTIVPKFPNYTMVLWDPSKTPDNGTYILAFDKGDGTAWVNGDDNLRETLPAQIVTLNHMLYDELTEDHPGIILDQADFETAAWKVLVSGSNIGDTWTIETGKKGTLYAYYLGFVGDFIQMNLGSYTLDYNNLRYYTNSELLQMNRQKYSASIWADGGFIYGEGRNVESNIKLFKLVTESSGNTSN